MQAPQPQLQPAEQEFTPEEQTNINLVREYMQIAYTPGRASANAVKHLCAPNNRFVASSTFPDVDTLEEYAEDHGQLMEQVNDLHIVSFDVLFARDDRVCRATPPKAAIMANRTRTSRRPGTRHAGPRPRFFR